MSCYFPDCGEPTTVRTPTGNELCDWHARGGYPVLTCSGDCGARQTVDDANEAGAHYEPNGDWWCPACWKVTQTERAASEQAEQAEAALQAYYSAVEGLRNIATQQCHIVHPGASKSCIERSRWIATMTNTALSTAHLCPVCTANHLIHKHQLQ